MSKIAIWLSRALMTLTVAALAFLPLVPEPAYAMAPSDSGTPPALSGARLERLWAREQRIYARLGQFFDRADDRIARAQLLIDRARDNGKDVSALQAALDAFSEAVKQARPVYAGGKGIVASHQGFDDNGTVVDPVKALGTVQEMRGKLQEIRQIVGPAARALRVAVHAFREANRPVPTPTAG